MLLCSLLYEICFLETLNTPPLIHNCYYLYMDAPQSLWVNLFIHNRPDDSMLLNLKNYTEIMWYSHTIVMFFFFRWNTKLAVDLAESLADCLEKMMKSPIPVKLTSISLQQIVAWKGYRRSWLTLTKWRFVWRKNITLTYYRASYEYEDEFNLKFTNPGHGTKL